MWRSLENNFFHLTYSTKQKQFKIQLFLMGRIYSIQVTLNFETKDLVNDGYYSNEHERYNKKTLRGECSIDEQRPHHCGIYHNYNEKQLESLPPSKRIEELKRRKAIGNGSRARFNVG